MHETKTSPARPSFWCGVLTAGIQATAPNRARTIRGPYTASNLANSQRDKAGPPAGQGTNDGEGRKKG